MLVILVLRRQGLSDYGACCSAILTLTSTSSMRDPVSKTKCGWHLRNEQKPQTCAHVHMHLNMHTAKCAKEFVRVLNDTVAPYLREEWLFPLFNIDQQFLNRFKVASISQLWEHLPSVDTFLVVARGRPLLWSGGRSQKCNWAFYVSLCMWQLLHATEHPIVSLCMWQLLQHRMPSPPASVVLQ